MQRSDLKVALTIAGSDPIGGAGIQSDLKTFSALGVYGCSAITIVIAQNSDAVLRSAVLDPALVRAQIEAVVSERRPDSVKTGALGNAAIVEAVADRIERLSLPAPVVDPVMAASSGARLLDRDGETALRERLLPLAVVVTPNIPEARMLSGIDIGSVAAMHAAAEAILRMGARAVVIKGGHLPKEFGAIDLLSDGHTVVELTGERITEADVHGTGCVFSAAIAAHLAMGSSLEESVRGAKTFVTAAIRDRINLGGGRSLPNHFAAARR